MIDFTAANKAFTDIYDADGWGGGSGASSVEVTRPYSEFLKRFMEYNNVQTVVDVGCGDWQFSREIDWGAISYAGYDVVQSVVKENTAKFASSTVRFDILNSADTLPAADLVVCKDVLHHLPCDEIATYLQRFSQRYKFALITNDRTAVAKKAGGEENVDHWINVPIKHGEWRPLRLDQAPFNLRIATLLEWDIEAPTWRWTKSVCLLMP